MVFALVDVDFESIAFPNLLVECFNGLLGIVGVTILYIGKTTGGAVFENIQLAGANFTELAEIVVDLRLVERLVEIAHNNVGEWIFYKVTLAVQRNLFALNSRVVQSIEGAVALRLLVERHIAMTQ